MCEPLTLAEAGGAGLLVLAVVGGGWWAPAGTGGGAGFLGSSSLLSLGGMGPGLTDTLGFGFVLSGGGAAFCWRVEGGVIRASLSHSQVSTNLLLPLVHFLLPWCLTTASYGWRVSC